MTKKTNDLTAKKIDHAKGKKKPYRLSDGGGLYLLIRSDKLKFWESRYKKPATDKYTYLGLGSYPDVSLVEARTKAKEVRKLVANGIDPKQHKEEKKRLERQQNANTLEVVAASWFEIKKTRIVPEYAKDIWSSLALHVFPKLGMLPLNQITAPHTIEILKPLVHERKLEMIDRLCQRLNEIMQYAVNTGVIFANPLAGIKAAFERPIVKNNPCLPPEQLPELMRAIATSKTKDITKYLITWQLHTMTRPNEAAKAQWSEIDFTNKVWRLPASKMKTRQQHIIPLTTQALALLEKLKPISGHRNYIFPSDRNPTSHTNPETANVALKRMGFKDRTTSHGLRALARTTLNKQGFDRDVMEAALSHVEKNQVVRAYNRDNYLDQRVPMMQWWSDHIEAASFSSVSLIGTLAK